MDANLHRVGSIKEDTIVLPVVTHHYCQITVETQCVESQEAAPRHHSRCVACILDLTRFQPKQDRFQQTASSQALGHRVLTQGCLCASFLWTPSTTRMGEKGKITERNKTKRQHARPSKNAARKVNTQQSEVSCTVRVGRGAGRKSEFPACRGSADRLPLIKNKQHFN